MTNVDRGWKSSATGFHRIKVFIELCRETKNSHDMRATGTGLAVSDAK